jgi:hypothetical protein
MLIGIHTALSMRHSDRFSNHRAITAPTNPENRAKSRWPTLKNGPWFTAPGKVVSVPEGRDARREGENEARQGDSLPGT